MVVGTGAEHVRIDLLDGPAPDPAEEPYNWLKVRVTGNIPPWHGEYVANLRLSELARFRTGVEALNQTLSGEASLEPLEPWMNLTLTGDGRGHVGLRGWLEAADGGQPRRRLEFELGLDQTYLAGIIDGLAELEREAWGR